MGSLCSDTSANAPGSHPGGGRRSVTGFPRHAVVAVVAALASDMRQLPLGPCRSGDAPEHDLRSSLPRTFSNRPPVQLDRPNHR